MVRAYEEFTEKEEAKLETEVRNQLQLDQKAQQDFARLVMDDNERKRKHARDERGLRLEQIELRKLMKTMNDHTTFLVSRML